MSVHTYMNARVRIDMSAVNLAPPHFIPPVMRSFVRDGESDYEKKKEINKEKNQLQGMFSRLVRNHENGARSNNGKKLKLSGKENAFPGPRRPGLSCTDVPTDSFPFAPFKPPTQKLKEQQKKKEGRKKSVDQQLTTTRFCFSFPRRSPFLRCSPLTNANNWLAATADTDAASKTSERSPVTCNASVESEVVTLRPTH